MEIDLRHFSLRLKRRWTIANRLGPGGDQGTDEFPVVLLQLRDADGTLGYGESAPSNRYAEDPDSVARFIRQIDPARLSFSHLSESLAYLHALAPGNEAAKCAVDIALHDGAARRARQPLHAFLGLPFTEGRHRTCFSIGIDAPEIIADKVREAAPFPLLKLKLGGSTDRENLAALRSVAPVKWVRVDANEAWTTRESALQRLEWLAADGHVELVEQPMPASTPREDWIWLKARSPLPLMADESYRSAADLPAIAACFHAVNVKLVKAGGVGPAHAALTAARQAGLKTMLGCMIETSILIAAATHLAELTDYLDLDGNLLVSNDPFIGPSADAGLLSFTRAPSPHGLRVAPQEGSGELGSSVHLRRET